jgi:hypothetical protein
VVFTGHSFLPHTFRRVRRFFIIFVDGIFTSFVERAFTSISDVCSGKAAIPCL